MATAYGIPIIFFGHAIHSVEKENLKLSYGGDGYNQVMRNIFVCRMLKSFGVGLVMIPLLVNNHQFFRERIKKFRNDSRD